MVVDINNRARAWVDLALGLSSHDGEIPELETVRTAELPAASAAIRAAYGAHQLTLPRHARDFELRLERGRFGPVEVSTMSVGADVDLVAPPARTFYLIILPLAGAVNIGTRGESVTLADHLGVVTNAQQPYYFEKFTPDCRFVCVRIERWQLDRAMGRIAGRPIDGSPEFDIRLDITDPAAASIGRALEHLAGEFGDSRTTRSPQVSQAIAEVVINALLLHHPHSHSHLVERTDQILPAAVRAADEFMQSHLVDEVTVGDIARAAAVSVRALEGTYQRLFGVSPMTSYRRLRLARAHDDLTAAPPDSLTVAEVARRWGFRHHGRFAIEYRTVYGLSPSEQLRRG